SRAEVDTNVVATETGTLIEVQGTGEGATFSRSTLDAMLDSALSGIDRLAQMQTDALAAPRGAPAERASAPHPAAAEQGPAATEEPPAATEEPPGAAKESR
ncbi:MAG: hypothetical protein L0I76_33740, partial [Pseudonocardia sp.]|nr:hypothetical protein [Pseudonocardia sp.]